MPEDKIPTRFYVVQALPDHTQLGQLTLDMAQKAVKEKLVENPTHAYFIVKIIQKISYGPAPLIVEDVS